MNPLVGWDHLNRSVYIIISLQVMKKSHEARQKLLRLGIFRHVEVVIDTAEGDANQINHMYQIMTYESNDLTQNVHI